MEQGEHIEKCIICLESNPIKGCFKNDYIKHIPCTCNAYIHEYCFYKTNNVNKCFICKNKYLYSFGHYPGNEPCCNKIDCKLNSNQVKSLLKKTYESFQAIAAFRNIRVNFDVDPH